MAGKWWTVQEDRYIRANYSHTPMAELERVLGKPRGAIYAYAERAGLKRAKVARDTTVNLTKMRRLILAGYSRPALAEYFQVHPKTIGRASKFLPDDYQSMMLRNGKRRIGAHMKKRPELWIR